MTTKTIELNERQISIITSALFHVADEGEQLRNGKPQWGVGEFFDTELNGYDDGNDYDYRIQEFNDLYEMIAYNGGCTIKLSITPYAEDKPGGSDHE